MEIETTLSRFIVDELLDERHGKDLGPDDSLLSSGLLDSLSVMNLIGFIEHEMGYHVSPADVTIENFQSVRTISDYLRLSERGSVDD